MPATSVKLQDVVDYARTFGELSPVLGVTGYSLRPALDIANDVMQTILAQPFNWKFNRANIPVFYTNSNQQDYAMPETQLSWLEHAYAIDFANTSNPKPVWTLEAVRDLEVTSYQFGRPGQISWLPNNQLTYGTWTANTAILSPTARVAISNPNTQIQDANGNYLIVTTFGTTGASAPVLPLNSNPGTTVTDGSVVWTVVDPFGQGFRLNPMPPTSGVIFEVHAVAQDIAPVFTSLNQTLAPLPDQFVKYFKQGFIAYCYRHSPEPQVRQKFPIENDLFQRALDEERRAGAREREACGFFPTQGIMSEQSYSDPGPAWPYSALW